MRRLGVDRREMGETRIDALLHIAFFEFSAVQTLTNLRANILAFGVDQSGCNDGNVLDGVDRDIVAA